MPRNVSLTPELERYAEEKVEAGLYASFSEVVREALREMMAREKTDEEKLEWLRDRLREGEESGGARPLDPETVKRRGRERLARAAESSAE